jgi:hypothetical protein
VLALLDEPHGNKKTFNFATGGWVAAPAVGKMVKRIAPLMGISPSMPGDDAAPDIAPKGAPKVVPVNRDLMVAVRAALDDVREARRAAR